MNQYHKAVNESISSLESGYSRAECLVDCFGFGQLDHNALFQMVALLCKNEIVKRHLGMDKMVQLWAMVSQLF